MDTSPRRSGVVFVDELKVARRAQGPADAVTAASRVYLRGEPLDMSALAVELGIGRATLYRWVGNREDLLAAVLAEGIERTFHMVMKEAQGSGVPLVLDCLRRFMTAVVDTPALQTLTQREPLVFIRLTTMPGAFEARAARLLADVLEQEAATGRLRLTVAPLVLGEAIVRICDSHLYAHLLGRTQPDIDSALRIVRLVLTAATE